ncbi:hypothetical protein MLD38_016208 [Melastoma candidum]|uniref:Uncharacterized protein n=1 Tax=Melastoma candidum TaxID=119954 RepID=A0ACB9RIR1_9MYRT|nr:hypothetical protein MLD38_016208 [Melastoma candidum]
MISEEEVDELVRVLGSSLSHVNWRLRPSNKRRLETDVMALCTGMRPVVMVDYGGKMPELKLHLCAFMKYCQKESSLFEHLRVMLIEDMIYILHDRGLAEHVESSLSLEKEIHLVDLEQDPPTIVNGKEETLAVANFLSVLKLFSVHFPLSKDLVDNSSLADTTPADSELLDLSNCLRDAKISLPTLNGWLLDYPVVYLFTTEHIEGAIRNLSTKSLRIFRILVCRNSPTSSSQQEELMSFSVPYDLSMRGVKEPWADAFLSYIQGKWTRCRYAWSSLQMEVSECYPQAIVL